MLDGGVKTRPATDLAEDRSRDPDECAALHGDRQDCARSLGEYGALGGARERVECLRVED